MLSYFNEYVYTLYMYVYLCTHEYIIYKVIMIIIDLIILNRIIKVFVDEKYLRIIWNEDNTFDEVFVNNIVQLWLK